MVAFEGERTVPFGHDGDVSRPCVVARLEEEGIDTVAEGGEPVNPLKDVDSCASSEDQRTMRMKEVMRTRISKLDRCKNRKG